MDSTDTARGPLTPMPTTAMVVMAVTAVDTDTDTARGLLTPMPTTAMAVMVAMPVMAVDTDTDTARGPLMLTTAVDTAMAAMATVDTPMASNFVQVCNNILIPNCHSIHLKTS